MILRLYCSLRTSCLIQKNCMISLVPLFKNSLRQNRNIQFKVWCTLFLFCRYLLHISARRPVVQLRTLRVMPQKISWLFPFAFFEFIRQLLNFLIWDSVQRWVDYDDILLNKHTIGYSEKQTPCTLVRKCHRSEEIAASIFKEEFILK